MKFRVFLSVTLFGLGLFYWSLMQCDSAFCNELTPFEAIYGITGNDKEAVEILKCVDEKSIQFANDHFSVAQIDEKDLTKKCLEDWLYAEAVKSSKP